VVCLDGSEPGYIEEAIEAGRMPDLRTALAIQRSGANLLADCVDPELHQSQQPVDHHRRPPAVHGIAGNFFYDPDTGRGSDDERPEVPARADDPAPPSRRRRREGGDGHRQGQAARPARQRPRLWAPGRARRFSAEKADKATLAENGIDNALAFVGMPLPDVYSADLSEFVFAAGVKLMETQASRPHVSLDHRLHPAQGRARHARSPTTSTP
jgi:phosphonoacetate hydrolase